MKKQQKKLITLMMIAAMTIASAITANAEIAVEGVSNNFFTIDRESGERIVTQLTFSKTPLAGKNTLENEVPIDNIDGYEWKYAYMYYDNPNTGYKWDFEVENAMGWRDLETLNTQAHYHIENFTIVDNNVKYTQCKYISADYTGGSFICVRVPSGYKGNMSYIAYAAKLENGERVSDYTIKFVFPFNTDDSPIIQTAPVWKQDAIGWKIENPDGSYLINTWYQSPSSGLWYYMGADGYMLVNTATPDGYFVNADGVWVH